MRMNIFAPWRGPAPDGIHDSGYRVCRLCIAALVACGCLVWYLAFKGLEVVF